MKKAASICCSLLTLLALSATDGPTLSAIHSPDVLAQTPEVGSVIVIVRARDAVESLLANGDVTVMQGGKLVKRATWDSVDYYVARSLLPGAYKVTANVPGYQSKSKSVTIKKYESVRIDIDLPLAPPARRPR